MMLQVNNFYGPTNQKWREVIGYSNRVPKNASKYFILYLPVIIFIITIIMYMIINNDERLQDPILLLKILTRMRKNFFEKL
jgi:hypothetical protein